MHHLTLILAEEIEANKINTTKLINKTNKQMERERKRHQMDKAKTNKARSNQITSTLADFARIIEYC